MKKSGAYALVPFAVFIGFYLISGMVLDRMGFELAFYQIPSSFSILVGLVSAFLLFRGSLDNKVSSFIKGCGDENIIIMCVIYLLAGAFSSVTKEMGAVDSVVNLSLSIIPPGVAVAGFFLIAVFLSTATGTSVGSIVALGSIAAGIAVKSGIPLPLMMGSLIGGAMAGDNLSVISDTTIAATRTQDVKMRDKFIMNFKIALPAIIITFFLFIFFAGGGTKHFDGDLSYSLLKLLPYLLVMIAAVMGVNVVIVLFSGIVLAGIIGIYFGSFSFVNLTNHIFNGFISVLDIFVLSMFTGGLANMVRDEGGISWATEKIKSMVHNRRSAELAFSSLISLTDLAVANNTVAILIVGPVAKEVSSIHDVDPRRMASLLDIFSCVFQGLIPYGAQILIACSLTGGLLSPMAVVPYVWYVYLLAIFALISIFIRYADSKEPIKPNEAIKKNFNSVQ